MSVTLLVEVKQQENTCTGDRLTYVVLLLVSDEMSLAGCQLQNKPDIVDSKRVCTNYVGCVRR